MSTRRILSCLLLPAYLSSCTSWQVQGVSPQQVIEREQPSRIRVTRTDRSEVFLDDPQVSGDMLIGFRRDMTYDSIYEATDTSAVLEIPLADISHVAISKTDVGKGILIGLGVAAVTMLVLAGIAVATMDLTVDCPLCGEEEGR